MAYNLNQLPPMSKQQEEDEDAIRSMAANLRILTEGIREYQGKVWGFDVTITQDAQPIFIDFLKLSNSLNVAKGTPIRIPGKPVYAVILTNMGGGNIKFSLGMDQGEGGSVVLLNGATKEFKSGRAKYTSVVVKAIGADATLNIGFEL